MDADVVVVGAGPAAVPTRPSGRLVLVRPDGYLAWVGTAGQFPA
jgi:hypothetical protein